MSGVAALPADACDSHSHVFEAEDDFPFAHPPSYTPPFAPFEMHHDLLAGCGLTRAVVVQPTVYGTDPTVMLRALHLGGCRLRGVGVATRHTEPDVLEAMSTGGIRGLRFVDTRLPNGAPYLGAITLDELGALAPAMTASGWHAETWAPLATILARWKEIERTDIPVVLDHMGSFDVNAGPAHPDFQRLLAMVREGQLWIKLVLCRRVPFGSSFDPLRPFHDALVEANPDRMLWGTDWPFVRMENPPPPAWLLDLFRTWINDAALIERILTVNPNRLYRFF